MCINTNKRYHMVTYFIFNYQIRSHKSYNSDIYLQMLYLYLLNPLHLFHCKSNMHYNIKL